MADIMDKYKLNKEELEQLEEARKKELRKAELARKKEKEAIKAKFPYKIESRELNGKNTRLQDSLVTPEQAEAARKAEQAKREAEKRAAEEIRRKRMREENQRKMEHEKKIAGIANKATLVAGGAMAAYMAFLAFTGGNNAIEPLNVYKEEDVENQIKDKNSATQLHPFKLSEELLNAIKESEENEQLDVNTAERIANGLIKMLEAIGLGEKVEVNNIEDLKSMASRMDLAMHCDRRDTGNGPEYNVTAAKKILKGGTLRSMVIQYAYCNSVDEYKKFFKDYLQIINPENDNIIPAIDNSFNMCAIENKQQTKQAQEDTTIYKYEDKEEDEEER